MAILIERATAADWAAMQAVFAAAGQAAWRHILPPEVLENPSPPDRWRIAIDGPDEVWVARKDGEVVGFTIVRASGDEDATPEAGEVDSFYTHPRVWGEGVGQALMAKAIERLQGLGFKTATLWTEERNWRPRAFYEAAGWTQDGTVRHRSLRGTELVEARWRIALRPVNR